MAVCTYCGKEAGWFKTVHKDCQMAHNAALKSLRDIALQVATYGGDLGNVKKELERAASGGFTTDAERRLELVSAWEQAAARFLEDGSLDKTEEDRLVAFGMEFDISDEEADRNGYLNKLAKAGVLRDLAEGKTPKRLVVEGNLPFKLEKNENQIYTFQGVSYLETKTRRHFKGSSQGVSIRIMKGVYYRVGAFKGHPVDTTENVLIDTGILLVTDKNLYFGGAQKSIKLRFGKVLSLVPFEDGVGVQMDAASSSTKIFVTGDGWFTYNLLAKLVGIGEA